VDVYARVAPEHKLRIVQRLKAQGEVVAVTGDGVNDAPALRAAHLGIAMGKGGTDVAREASDMVLADDNFATITAAVEEGRVVFSNIRKVTFFLLSTGVGQIITILVALALGWPLPILAAQILWINLVTNGLQDVALAFEPGRAGAARRRRRGRPRGGGHLAPAGGWAASGLVLAAGTLGMFWWCWQEHRRPRPRPHRGDDADGGLPVLPRLQLPLARPLDLLDPAALQPFLFVSSPRNSW
jgi:magnesium-transporting ATPase (P-type)